MREMASAQSDMRLAYLSGAPGMLTSAVVWFAAAIAAAFVSPRQAVWVLFIGGGLIHPISILLCKALGRSGKHASDNPLASLALGSTFWMLFCLPLVYGAGLLRIEWFFPAMLLVIGGRYLTLVPLYGLRLYWAVGLTLAGAAYPLAAIGVAPMWSALAGAAIEAVFAAALFVTGARESQIKAQSSTT